MTNLDRVNAAEEAAIDGIVSDATAPLQAQLDNANADLQAAQAVDAADQATITQLQGQVSALQAQLAVQPTPAVVQPDAGLAFTVDREALAASPKLLLAHYFPPYPTSLDNADPAVDYYTRNYLNLNGESGSHKAYGGLLRNRPLGRAPLSGDWAETDRQREIQAAVDAGINGFAVDLLSPSGTNWTRALAIATTADTMFPDGSFKVVPMFDTTASFGKETSQQVADALAQFANRPCAYTLPDGRFVVSSFKAEQLPVSWWDATFTAMKTTHSIDVAFLGGYLNISSAANFAGYPWTYGSGDWGDGADPGIAAVTGASDKSVAVKGRGEKWMQPVQPQNVRPNQHVFDEAMGTASLRGWWERAIRCDADYAQLVTWSDWSESGAIAPSVMGGTVALDLSLYYVIKWKTGEFPAIVGDVLYLSHRTHFANATWASGAAGQTQFMQHWARGTGESSVVDIVECVSMLQAPASVTVTIGTVTHTYDAPAGMFVQTFPLAVGQVTAAASRNGAAVAQLTSPFAVTDQPFKDVFMYASSSSGRGTTGQYDCNTQ